MSFDNLRKRYQDDAKFHQIVNTMYSILYNYQVTVSDLQSAAYFAALKFEQEHVNPIPFIHPHLLEGGEDAEGIIDPKEAG